MKTVTKFAAAAVLALATAAPALAFEQTQLERNTYLYTADARPIVAHMHQVQADVARGTDAMALAPATQTIKDPAENISAY